MLAKKRSAIFPLNCTQHCIEVRVNSAFFGTFFAHWTLLFPWMQPWQSKLSLNFLLFCHICHCGSNFSALLLLWTDLIGSAIRFVEGPFRKDVVWNPALVRYHYGRAVRARIRPVRSAQADAGQCECGAWNNFQWGLCNSFQMFEFCFEFERIRLIDLFRCRPTDATPMRDGSVSSTSGTWDLRETPTSLM